MEKKTCMFCGQPTRNRAGWHVACRDQKLTDPTVLRLYHKRPAEPHPDLACLHRATDKQTLLANQHPNPNPMTNAPLATPKVEPALTLYEAAFLIASAAVIIALAYYGGLSAILGGK